MLVQLKRALDPESEEIRLANMRSISRQMKGFKLQYLKDETVFFDDVAGISAAKVHIPFCVVTMTQLDWRHNTYTHWHGSGRLFAANSRLMSTNLLFA